MTEVLRELITTGAMTGPDGNRLVIDSHIPEDEGRHIQQVISRLRPSTTLEVGMAYGVSTLFICEALSSLPHARHIVIDPYQNDAPDDALAPDQQPADPGWRGIGLYNVRRAGYGGMVEFIGKPSYLALPELLASGRRIQYALIDGMHTFDFALVDFFFVDRLLDIGGVVTFDDLSYPSIRKLCRYVLTNRTYRVFPDSNSPPARPSKKRAVFKRLLGWPGVGTWLRRWCRPELVIPDDSLGLPAGQYVSLQKTTEDVIMSVESEKYRRWDSHRAF